MKPLSLLVTAAAILAATACNADNGNTAAGAASPAAAAPVAAPKDGDWSAIVSQTAAGGFLMGNPAAKVKLVEYGSMTCHYCADFEEQGGKPLVDNYVKKGLVSFEFRNFVRDPYDLAASLIARCGGTTSFFGLTRAFYADQEGWMAKLQAADPAAMQALQSQPPQQQFKAIAEMAGFPAFVAMRGLPRKKTEACLADPAGASKLVEMNSDASANYNLAGTPTFLIDDKIVEGNTWKLLEPAIKTALGG